MQMGYFATSILVSSVGSSPETDGRMPSIYDIMYHESTRSYGEGMIMILSI